MWFGSFFWKKRNGSMCFKRLPQVSGFPAFAGAGFGQIKNPGGMAPL